MTAETSISAGHRSACLWCGKEIDSQPSRGRKRKYCSPSCKQRAYEQRNNLGGSPVVDGSVVLRPERVGELRDELYELRCAAEDIRTAVEECADSEEIRHLCDELVNLATQIEKLR